MLELKKITSSSDIIKTACLAHQIWNQHFQSIISQQQIDYMLDQFQSYKEISEQITNQGYEYYNFVVDNRQVGYFAFCQKPNNTLFLSKIYLQKKQRGKGYAKKAFELMKNKAKENGNTMIWLTVNKKNEIAINAYKKLGMEVIREEETDIGNGFIMDDYVFGLNL